jgi:hypothetical protein
MVLRLKKLAARSGSSAALHRFIGQYILLVSALPKMDHFNILHIFIVIKIFFWIVCYFLSRSPAKNRKIEVAVKETRSTITTTVNLKQACSAGSACSENVF